MSELRFCVVGCTRPVDDGGRIRVQTTPPAYVCDRCEETLRRRLREIPDRYALLPAFIEHGTTETNPDSKATTQPWAPAPMRLEVVDHLDTRHGRQWLGTAPTDDYRGVLGVLESWARLVREERNLPPPSTRPTVTGEAHTLARHLTWIAAQPWVDEFHAELRTLDRDLAAAVGDHRVRPVGTCTVEVDDGPCGGPLMPTDEGTVRCVRCHDRWSYDDLRRLGLLLEEGGHT